MTRICFILCLVFCVPTAGVAQDYDIRSLPKGYSVSWDTDIGRTTFTLTGRLKGHFTRDDSKKRAQEGVIFLNKKGETKRFTSKEFDISFRPHDCFLTAGLCKYKEELSDGRYRFMRREATVKDNDWSYRLYFQKDGKWVLEEQGTYTVDSYGYVIERNFMSDGKKHWSRRIDN